MEFKIKNRYVGEGHPLFFIAEAGVNHNGSIELGKKLIDIGTSCGVDAVKFQTFKTENIITKGAPKANYHIETTGEDSHQTWYELLKTQEMSREMHVELIKYSKKNDIIFLSTPYDEDSADLLEELEVPAYKIASTDLNNLPFIKYIAHKGLPMILSTAFSTMEEVEESISTVRNEGLESVALLQCTGNYPAKMSDSNLLVMKDYKEKLNCIVGYSDHTQELINPVAATAMGAKIFEKHFTIDKSMPGPDHRMSLNPDELKKTVRAIRCTENALGSSKKTILLGEKDNRIKLRKSIVANGDIKKNEIIQKDMISIKRPGSGIPPSDIEKIIGKRAANDIKNATLLSLEMVNE
jgi:N,N'-diacetyllegionaminate synthase